MGYEQFIANSNSNFFAVDICTLVTNGTCAGASGDITTGVPGTASVPEPATLALFGAGLFGCALFLARRRARRKS